MSDSLQITIGNSQVIRSGEKRNHQSTLDTDASYIAHKRFCAQEAWDSSLGHLSSHADKLKQSTDWLRQWLPYCVNQTYIIEYTGDAAKLCIIRDPRTLQLYAILQLDLSPCQLNPFTGSTITPADLVYSVDEQILTLSPQSLQWLATWISSTYMCYHSEYRIPPAVILECKAFNQLVPLTQTRNCRDLQTAVALYRGIKFHLFNLDYIDAFPEDDREFTCTFVKPLSTTQSRTVATNWSCNGFGLLSCSLLGIVVQVVDFQPADVLISVRSLPSTIKQELMSLRVSQSALEDEQEVILLPGRYKVKVIERTGPWTTTTHHLPQFKQLSAFFKTKLQLKDSVNPAQPLKQPHCIGNMEYSFNALRFKCPGCSVAIDTQSLTRIDCIVQQEWFAPSATLPTDLTFVSFELLLEYLQVPEHFAALFEPTVYHIQNTIQQFLLSAGDAQESLVQQLELTTPESTLTRMLQMIPVYGKFDINGKEFQWLATHFRQLNSNATAPIPPPTTTITPPLFIWQLNSNKVDTISVTSRNIIRRMIKKLINITPRFQYDEWMLSTFGEIVNI